jgi:hypothetical protein
VKQPAATLLTRTLREKQASGIKSFGFSELCGMMTCAFKNADSSLFENLILLGCFGSDERRSHASEEHKPPEAAKPICWIGEAAEEHETRVAQPSPAVCMQRQKSLVREVLYQGTSLLVP